jgi:hypothetical protein
MNEIVESGREPEVLPPAAPLPPVGFVQLGPDDFALTFDGVAFALFDRANARSLRNEMDRVLGSAIHRTLRAPR